MRGKRTAQDRAMNKAAGERLRTTRKKRGLSQEALAEALDVSTTTVQKHENGTSALTFTWVVRYARAFDMEYSLLLHLIGMDTADVCRSVAA